MMRGSAFIDGAAIRGARASILLIGVLGVPCLAWSQVAPQSSAANHARDLLHEARAAPVEIFADIVLNSRLLSLLSKRDTVDVLESVFWSTRAAVEAWPMDYSGPSPLEGPDADRAGGHRMRLDALTIRCRVILELLKIDPRLARKLFETIAQPVMPKTGCEERFVPNASIYAVTLAAIAHSPAFSEEERKRGVPRSLVESYARSLRSSWEIVASAKKFPDFGGTEKDAVAISQAVAQSLALSDDDRAFTNATRTGSLVSEVLAAAEKLHATGATQMPILTGLRAYLIRHLSAVRCRENDAEVLAVSPDAKAVEEFNAFVRGRTSIAPISVKETKPAAIESVTASPRYVNAATYQSMVAEVERISMVVAHEMADGRTRASMRKKPFGEEDNVELRARDLLFRIEDLSPSPGQDPMEVFHQRCFLLRTLVTAPLREDTLLRARESALSVLNDPTVLSRSPAQWLFEYRRFIASSKVLRDLARSEKEKAKVSTSNVDLFRMLAGSGLLAPSLYGRIELFAANLP